MRRRTLLQGEGVIDITSAVVTAASQTYDGTAKTPAVTVTLHGSVIDAANYDVTYSSNTNAGTAYITVTGKGDYTGTATGTFNIAKSAPSYTAPTATNPTYNGSSQQLTTTGTTAHGTIQYSADGSSWSDLPIERTNAGGYTTYWRLVGDANHTSIGATSITTYIYKASRILSFSSSYAVLDHGGTVTRTATVSAGAGDGAVTYSVGSTTYASVGYTSGKVTAKSTDGSTTITATISEGTNYLSASASYTLYVFSTAAHDYSYNGSYHSVTLPPGRYNLQVWGAQGGSNAADSSYGITAQAGGKGGYSEGVLTLTSATDVRVYVGGAGSLSAGGYNGGGSTSGSASYSSGNTYGTSRMGGGGGATDIRLSDGALLSRMIVAGGGAGGAMLYQKVTTTTTSWSSLSTQFDSYFKSGSSYITSIKITGWSVGDYIRVKAYNPNNSKLYIQVQCQTSSYSTISTTKLSGSSYSYITIPSNTGNVVIQVFSDYAGYIAHTDITRSADKQVTTTSTTTSNESQVGGVGGGTQGGAYSSTYAGKQNAAGSGGSFGQGANQTATNYRYCSGAGGGGWYGGGGGQKSDSSMTCCKYSGGGSGFVNTAASASYRPSGYTGKQLDSGTTYAGNQSFPSPSGGNETGHAGNGYARITRIA